MKISKILDRNKPSISFEVFPPKRHNLQNEMSDGSFKEMNHVKGVINKLSKLNPSYISVTYGAAGGNTGANTAEIAGYVENDCGITALAHLTCLMSGADIISSEIEILREKGIENILCLRGDYPPDFDSSSFHGGFSHAIDLVKALSGKGFTLGGACYPECHPECEHIETDIAYLKEKTDAGVEFLTTQMFFDNNVFFHYLARLRNAGIVVPVVAGIMPVTNGRQIARICRLSGTVLPPRFRAIVDRFGDNPVAMMDAGVAYATEQIIDLFANGVNNVHLYTMNKPEIAERIMVNLNGIIA